MQPVGIALITASLLSSSIHGVAGPHAAGRMSPDTTHASSGVPATLYGSLWSAAVGPQGSVYVLNRATAQLLKLSPAGRPVGRWSVPPIYVPNQPADLTGIALSPHHTIYITDSANDQVVTLTLRGQIIASWDTRHAGAGRFFGPFGVATDEHGNIYVTDFTASDVEEYSPSGKLLMTFGHPCPQAPGSEASPRACLDAGHESPGELNHPDSIAVDHTGNVYVSDHRSRRVVKFSPTGEQLGVIGPHLPAPYGTLGLTEGVAVDSTGNVYIEDRRGPRVVKLSPAGGPLAQWRTPKGYVPEGTPGIDSAGNLYVTLNAERGPSMVAILTPNLTFRTRWM